jgi:hypothetical protein
MNIKLFKNILPFAAILLFLTSLILAGCQPQATATVESEGEHEAEHEEGEEHEHGDRVPNDGAVIQIVSPADGATFQQGEDIVVEVAVENFDLTVEGAHWHLYVDEEVYSQVVGGGTKEVIHGLEPGEHTIEVYLGLPTHEEFEDGASITIDHDHGYRVTNI